MTGREATCAHVLLSDERCDVCGEFVASGRQTTPPCGPGGRGLPHQPDERGYCSGCTGLFNGGRETTCNWPGAGPCPRHAPTGRQTSRSAESERSGRRHPLADALAELERTDPAVKAAAESFERAMRTIMEGRSHALPCQDLSCRWHHEESPPECIDNCIDSDVPSSHDADQHPPPPHLPRLEGQRRQGGQGPLLRQRGDRDAGRRGTAVAGLRGRRPADRAVPRRGPSLLVGNTPPRSVRVPDSIWQAATARAKAEGTTVTAVILAALTRYAKGYKP